MLIDAGATLVSSVGNTKLTALILPFITVRQAGQLLGHRRVASVNQHLSSHQRHKLVLIQRLRGLATLL